MQAGIFEEILVLGPTKHEFQMDPFALSNHQGSNQRDPIRGCSFYETPKNISLSVYTLLQEFKSVVLEKDELEYHDKPIQ